MHVSAETEVVTALRACT